MTEAEIDHIELGEVDPAEARGWFILYRYECTLEDLEPILYSRHQDEQYPEADYDDYSREYTSSLDDYTSGASETLTWEVVIEGSYLNTAYTERLLGGLRRSDEVLMARTWLPAPAELEEACTECQGQGRVKKAVSLTVNIPAGVAEGNYIPLRGQGSVGPRGGAWSRWRRPIAVGFQVVVLMPPVGMHL